MNKSKILFIINPISGGGKQKKVFKLIRQYLNRGVFTPEIVYTEAPKHATKLSSAAVGEFDFVIAVGGDGSINEVSQGLINSTVAMGILPFGSGNGLARHLNIPLHTIKAIELLNTKSKRTIDTFSVNNEQAVNVAGVGFDAHIAHKFATYGKRGFASYAKLTLSEFVKYQPLNYELYIDGEQYHRDAFLISFANSSQFGNNAHIAPQALIDDGLIDVSILKPFPKRAALRIGQQLFSGSLDRSYYFESFRCKHVSVRASEAIASHIDGEPMHCKEELTVSVLPHSLIVVAPPH